MPKCLPVHWSSRAWDLRMGAPQPLSPAPGPPRRMPRYLAWSWVLISEVTGAARWRASTAASKLRGLNNGATTVFE
eukprot:9324459-Alexandrium_andersonii.AAC.1